MKVKFLKVNFNLHVFFFFLISKKDVLQKLLKDPEIQKCRLRRDGSDDDNLVTESMNKFKKEETLKKSTNSFTTSTEPNTNGSIVPDDITNYIEKMEKDDDEENYNQNIQLISFEVNQEEIENIQKRCIQLEYPLLAEYDFKNDTHNPNIK